MQLICLVWDGIIMFIYSSSRNEFEMKTFSDSENYFIERLKVQNCLLILSLLLTISN